MLFGEVMVSMNTTLFLIESLGAPSLTEANCARTSLFMIKIVAKAAKRIDVLVFICFALKNM
jgi:hypothetical protein